MFRRGKPYRDKENGNRYVAVWFIDGQRYRRRTPYTRKIDVEKFLAQCEEEYNRTQGGWIKPDNKRSLRSSVDAFLRDHALNKTVHTYKQYRGVLENFLAFCGDNRRLVSLATNNVESFLAAHKDTGVAAATLAADLRVIRTFASWCVKQGWIRRSFAADVAPIRVPKGRVRFLKPHQVAPFLKSCTPTFLPIAILTIFCGLRRKELVNLRWKDVDFDDGTLYATGAKTNNVRGVPLHPLALEELQKIDRISEYVFPITKDSHHRFGVSLRGDKRSENTQWFNAKTKQAAARIGLAPDELDYHGLRKTFAMLVQGTGHDARMTGHLLGHGPGSRGAVTDLYVFADLDRQRSAVEAIDIGEEVI